MSVGFFLRPGGRRSKLKPVWSLTLSTWMSTTRCPATSAIRGAAPISISAARLLRSTKLPESSPNSAAFRQVSAVLGAALLVAIVGDPGSLDAALDGSDAGYQFAILAALASGVAALALSVVREGAAVSSAPAR